VVFYWDLTRQRRAKNPISVHSIVIKLMYLYILTRILRLLDILVGVLKFKKQTCEMLEICGLLGNYPEDRRFHQHRGGSLKS
jgi:hypothetical protein